MQVAIVGGGISGLACAHALNDANHTVAVFDKARAPGGRVCTRRVDSSQFDHGAQYFTARDPRFERHVKNWIDRGVVAEWKPRIITIDQHGTTDLAFASQRYVGTPSMSAISRHLAQQIDVRAQTKITGLERRADKWTLKAETDIQTGEYDAVVMALPPAQAAPLLDEVACVQAITAGVPMSSCWAFMAQLDHEHDPGFDAAFLNDDVVSWIARDGSKPDRPDAATWVVHASKEWSARHAPDDRAIVTEILESKLGRLLGLHDPHFVKRRLHFWRYAAPVSEYPEPCVLNPQLQVGACGDWCTGGRIEGAFLSGLAMAERLTSNWAKAV